MNISLFNYYLLFIYLIRSLEALALKLLPKAADPALKHCQGRTIAASLNIIEYI